MAKGINQQAPLGEQKRCTENIGSRHITTSDFGSLRVVKCMEVVPGDVVSLDIKGFTQLAQNAAPVNGDIMCGMHAFFVPNRILFNPFNDYITGLSDSDLPCVPLSFMNGHVDGTGKLVQNFAERVLQSSPIEQRDALAIFSGLELNPYLVYKTNNSQSIDPNISVLPFMAYQRIWFDWYSNKNFVGSDQLAAYGLDTLNPIVSGQETDATHWMLDYWRPRYGCFKKDYITSSLVSPAGTVGGSGTLPISSSFTDKQGQPNNFRTSGLDSYDTNYADGEFEHTVPQLRTAVAYQKWLEKANYLGKNIISRLRGMFGGNATPERLQMSEYLGGNYSPVSFERHSASTGTINEDSDVNAFGATNRAAESMLGQQYDQGNANMSLKTSPYSVQEHGYIIVISNILPKPQYFQTLPRMWFRGCGNEASNRFDFFHSEFEQEGFQPVYMHEVCNPMADIEGRAPVTVNDPWRIFGWQPKYIDYHYTHDFISGDFLRPETRVSMQQFHLGRDMLREFGFIGQDGKYTPRASTTPVAQIINLQSTAQCQPATRQMYDDKFMVPSSTFDHFIIDFKIGVTASRPMSALVAPSLDGIKHDGQMIELGGIRL